jgi:hypothetical protein
MPKTAAVLGAGIQGCCAALALAQLGFQVNLYDKSSALFSRASVNQEGKIHLGIVYARDPSLQTARTMIEHAMQFGPAIESLLGGPVDWAPHLSENFYCAIHDDSSLSMEEHYVHFQALQEIYSEISESPGLLYLGSRPKKIWTETTAHWFRRPGIRHLIETAEQAVHPVWMRNLIVQAVERDVNIECYLNHDILEAGHRNGSISITGEHPGGSWAASADVIVNCLWEGRARIDQSIGIPDPGNWVTRIKYGFILDSVPAFRDVPSLILTHGPFGDIVNYTNYNQLYVTWYPECLSYFGADPFLPQKWEDACNGAHPDGHVEDVLTATLEQMNRYLPGVRNLTLRQVMAGTILGQGRSDISDHNSGLHNRHNIGVTQSGDYYSIFTGKYTSGPANAIALKRMLS